MQTFRNFRFPCRRKYSVYKDPDRSVQGWVFAMSHRDLAGESCAAVISSCFMLEQEGTM